MRDEIIVIGIDGKLRRWRGGATEVGTGLAAFLAAAAGEDDGDDDDNDDDNDDNDDNDDDNDNDEDDDDDDDDDDDEGDGGDEEPGVQEVSDGGEEAEAFPDVERGRDPILPVVADCRQWTPSAVPLDDRQSANRHLTIGTRPTQSRGC